MARFFSLFACFQFQCVSVWALWQHILTSGNIFRCHSAAVSCYREKWISCQCLAKSGSKLAWNKLAIKHLYASFLLLSEEVRVDGSAHKILSIKRGKKASVWFTTVILLPVSWFVRSIILWEVVTNLDTCFVPHSAIFIREFITTTIQNILSSYCNRHCEKNRCKKW